MPRRTGKSPSLWQTLLNRPSQSYSFPQVDKKEYYSAKNDMVKIAMEVEAEALKVSSVAAIKYGFEGNGLEAATVQTKRLTNIEMAVDERPNRIHEDESQAKRHSRSFSTPEVTLTEVNEAPSGDEASDSDDDDVFYTPNTSPRVSIASTASVPETPTHASSPRLSPSDPATPPTFSPVTRTPSSHSIASTSADSSSADGHSIFSSYASSSGSTVLTTPEPSIRSSNKGRSKAKGRETSTTSEEWAKDVRWLVPPPSTPSSSGSSSSRRKNGTQARKSSRSSSANKYQPTTMTTLVEEDEGISASISRANSKSSQSKGKSASNISSPKRRSSTRSSSHPTPPVRPNLSRRRSRSLEDIAAVALGRDDDVFSSSSVSSSAYTAHATTTPSLPSYGTPGYTSLTLPRAPPPSSGFLEPGKKTGKVDLTRSGVAQTTMASVEVTRGLSSSASSSKRFSWLSKDKDLVKAKGKGRQESLFSFTSYRKPPTQVPEGHALVQIWAVGVDGVDASLSGISTEVVSLERRSMSESGRDSDDGTVKRNWGTRRNSSASATSSSKLKQPEVGFVPGRSFVGRIIEVGDEGGARKKGEWVVGLLDVRKCGALQEFVVVDRHRIHSVPHPALPPSALIDPTSTFSPSPVLPAERFEHEPHDSRYPAYTPTRVLSPETPLSPSKTQLTLEELALLPACGVQAYRAVRTFVNPTGWGSHTKGRVLVIRGHDGLGAVATQMLVNRGWRVCVHAPLWNGSHTQEEEEMERIKERVTSWGADEVIFDAGDADGGLAGAVQQMIEDNEVFDGILDTVGGKGIWELGKKLLSRGGNSASDSHGVKQFTTIVGDFPLRPVPSASDHFKASLRSMKGADGNGSCRVAYSWVSVDQDVDFEGGDVAAGLAKLLGECTGSGELRPFVGDGRVVTFERAHEVFRVDGGLEGGGTVVVRVVT
ncbi:hypothetical protein AAF712_007333 [Marasmius tenuissimus]|uniref:Enhancer of mRNA-decapping protein 3 n=1 Tax=Marasmius tenuissimus TaxID=585030 RepID=A0ABR2ZXA4_9AGAR